MWSGLHWPCVLATLVLAVISAAAVLHSLRQKRCRRKVRGVVKQLWIYPIKSCGGIPVEEAYCTSAGLQQGKLKDRHWLVATEDGGIFVTQRQVPKMTLIWPTICEDSLLVDAPGMKRLTLSLDGPEASADGVKALRVWSDKVPGLCCGDEAAEWFSAYLGQSVRLYYSHPSLKRRAISEKKSHRGGPRPREDNTVAYADGYPYLLANEQSLADLNSRLSKPVSMLCFRPNIVIDGPVPYEEDLFRSVWIGQRVQLYHEKPCDRCLIPTVNLKTGEKDPNREPQATLMKYRILPQVSTSSPCFAINLVLEEDGKIMVGDELWAECIGS